MGNLPNGGGICLKGVAVCRRSNDHLSLPHPDAFTSPKPARGAPVLLLHQTPRSWDEFRDVLPLLGRHYRAIAMDTVGYGNSDPLPQGQASIENWAKAAHQLLVALNIERVAVVGHHTGASIAIEIAASYSEQVAALVLSASPHVDAARRTEAKAHKRAVVDEVTPRMDGGHLAELWSMRQSFYPPDRIDLLERFIIDALKAGRAPPKAIALSIVTRWKSACRSSAARRS